MTVYCNGFTLNTYQQKNKKSLIFKISTVVCIIYLVRDKQMLHRVMLSTAQLNISTVKIYFQSFIYCASQTKHPKQSLKETCSAPKIRKPNQQNARPIYLSV